MRYYNPSSGTIAHERELISSGINVQNRIVMSTLGWYDLYDNDQYIYNANICKLVQTGDPVFTNNSHYVQNYQIVTLSYTEMLDKLDVVKYHLYTDIDEYINNRIIAGFDTCVETDVISSTFHFSYDKTDQNNFSDAANLSMISLNMDIDISTVDWNGYKDYSVDTGGILVVLTLNALQFFKLYSDALHHKTELLRLGEEIKTIVDTAVSVEDLKIKMSDYSIEVNYAF